MFFALEWVYWEVGTKIVLEIQKILGRRQWEKVRDPVDHTYGQREGRKEEWIWRLRLKPPRKVWSSQWKFSSQHWPTKKILNPAGMSLQKKPPLHSVIDWEEPGICGLSTNAEVVPEEQQLGQQSTMLPAADLSSSYSWTPHSSNFQLSSPTFLSLILFIHVHT